MTNVNRTRTRTRTQPHPNPHSHTYTRIHAHTRTRTRTRDVRVRVREISFSVSFSLRGCGGFSFFFISFFVHNYRAAMRRVAAPNPRLRWGYVWLLLGLCITQEQCRPERQQSKYKSNRNTEPKGGSFRVGFGLCFKGCLIANSLPKTLYCEIHFAILPNRFRNSTDSVPVYYLVNDEEPEAPP